LGKSAWVSQILRKRLGLRLLLEQFTSDDFYRISGGDRIVDAEGKIQAFDGSKEWLGHA